MNKKLVIETLSSYDVVSFDIYDTLITRKIAEPKQLFKLVQASASVKAMDVPNFSSDRVEAEKILIKNVGYGYDLEKIYEILKEKFNYSSQQLELLKQLELSFEIELATPRKTVVDILNSLVQMGREVILVSDMYLSKKTIKTILQKCGIPSNVPLFLSNEYNASKIEGDLWTIVMEAYPSMTVVHLGDDLIGDNRRAIQKGISKHSILIKKPFESFLNSSFGQTIMNNFDRNNIGDLILLGLLVSSLHNDPWSQEDLLGVPPVWLIAPFLPFIDRLSQIDDNSQLLFVTREGYLLKPWFDNYQSKLKNKKKTFLFPCSRVASTLASIHEIKDLSFLLNQTYSGTIRDFLNDKIYLPQLLTQDNAILSKDISLPKDKKLLLEFFQSHSSYLLNKAAEQRLLLKEWIKKENISIINSVFIDIGYNGTTQYNLSKALEILLKGSYLFLEEYAPPKKLGCDCMSIGNVTKEIHPIYENLLFFEAALQVNKGSVLSYLDSSDGVKLKVGKSPQINYHVVNAQREAEKIFIFLGEMKGLLHNNLNFDLKLSENIWINLLKFGKLPKSFLSSLELEDNFNGLDVLHFYPEENVWRSKNKTIRVSIFNSHKNFNLRKTNLKYWIKKHIPLALYPYARDFWIKYLK